MPTCFICKGHIKQSDMFLNEKRLLETPVHLDCYFQEILDRRGKGEKLSDVLAQNPHVRKQYDALAATCMCLDTIGGSECLA